MGYMTSRAMPVQPIMSMGYAPAPPMYHFPQSLSAAPSQQVPALFYIRLANCKCRSVVFVKCVLALTCTHALCPKPSCPALNPALP